MGLHGASPGADEFAGGAGYDWVNYRSVAVTSGVSVIQDGLANDGPPGEHDNIQADVEAIDATEFTDTVVASGVDNDISLSDGDDQAHGGGGNDWINGSLGVDDLNGGPGDDELKGSWFGDTITGGPGKDLIDADDNPNPGDDVIRIRDGEFDEVVDCGGGNDTVIAARGDRDDEIAADCEKVTRS